MVHHHSLADIAIIGGGWAGCSAAFTAHQQNMQAHVFDMGAILGGRARHAHTLGIQNFDNGQHLLVGAYHSIWQQLQAVNAPIDTLFYWHTPQWHMQSSQACWHIAPSRTPLQMLLNTLKSQNTRQGVAWRDVFSWLCIMLAYKNPQRMQKKYSSICVEDWYIKAKISPFLQAHFFTPLCLAMLNTAPDKALMHYFTHVIHKVFGEKHHNAALYIPKLNLSSVYPSYMTQYATVHLKAQVKHIQWCKHTHIWQVHYLQHATQKKQNFKHVVLATPWHVTQKFLTQFWPDDAAYQNILADIPALNYTPITTLYVQACQPLHLPFLMYEDVAILNYAPAHAILSIVFSHQALQKEDCLYWLAKHAPILGLKLEYMWHICEKRATHSADATHQCFLQKMATFKDFTQKRAPSLVIAGDYLHPHYPATLEGAAAMGKAAVESIIHSSI